MTFGEGALDWAPEGLEWQADALCKEVGISIFYAEEKGESTVVNLAKSVCNGGADRDPCPVRSACLAWALEINDHHAVLGGMSARQRQKFATEQRRTNGTGTSEQEQRICDICRVTFIGTMRHRYCGLECRAVARQRRDRRRVA